MEKHEEMGSEVAAQNEANQELWKSKWKTTLRQPLTARIVTR